MVQENVATRRSQKQSKHTVFSMSQAGLHDAVFLASLKGNGGKDTSQNAILSNDGTLPPLPYQVENGCISVSPCISNISFFAFCLAIFRSTLFIGEKANAHYHDHREELDLGALNKNKPQIKTLPLQLNS